MKVHEFLILLFACAGTSSIIAAFTHGGWTLTRRWLWENLSEQSGERIAKWVLLFAGCVQIGIALLLYAIFR